MNNNTKNINNFDLHTDLNARSNKLRSDWLESESIVDLLGAGHSAAPLLIVGSEADPSLVRAQDTLARQFYDMTIDELTTRNVKPSVAEWAGNSIRSRMSEREGLNGSNYSSRLHETPNIDNVGGYTIGEIVAACYAAQVGEGTIEQNRIAQLAYGMRSAEYANLTIIGDQRKEFELDMWQQLSELTGKDVTDISKGIYRTTILGYNCDPKTAQHIGAMRISTKRHLDIGDHDTYLKVRETAIIDTSPGSGFDQTIVAAIIAAEQADIDPLDDIRVKRMIEGLRQVNMDSSIVLARNETVYGDSKEFGVQIDSRRKLVDKTRRSLGAVLQWV